MYILIEKFRYLYLIVLEIIVNKNVLRKFVIIEKMGKLGMVGLCCFFLYSSWFISGWYDLVVV